MQQKLFWFDVETTGLNYYNNEIISLAYLIEIDNKIVETGTLYTKPDNPQFISSEAMKINGFTPEQLESFPSQKQLYEDIKSVLDKYSIRNKSERFTPAGYNCAGCDIIFLQQLFLTHNKNYAYEYFDYFKSSKIDVFTMLPIMEEITGLNFASHRLQDIAPIFKIPHDAHNATSDILATIRLYKIFMHRLKNPK